MPAERITAEFIGKKERGPKIRSFIFRPETDFSFKAGQFANFFLDGEKMSRYFSFSGSPLNENIEITTIISESDFKKRLDSLAAGEKIVFAGPMGNFTLDSRKHETVNFLCGGIGITPVISMLRYSAEKAEDLNAVLFYSNRDTERITFRSELEEIERKLPNFKIVHTLTNLSEEEKKNWQGESGFISEEMIKRHSPDFEKRQFYIVGPPAFNNAMKKLVHEQMGISSEFITMENFAGY